MKKKIIVLVIICILGIRFSALLIEAYGYRRQKAIEIDKVEKFFEENGYAIEIKGAYMGGRESEGPFLYGWYWLVFDI